MLGKKQDQRIARNTSDYALRSYSARQGALVEIAVKWCGEIVLDPVLAMQRHAA